MISANMSLILPTVGVTPGPDYATDLNTSLSLVDAHDHTAGKGVSITPAGININSDLTMANFSLINTNRVGFTTLSSPLSDLRSVYSSGVDLYFTDGNGNQIQITQGGGIAGSPGSIANLVSPASASYVSISEKFVWQSDSNKAASMDFASAILRNSTVSSFGLTLAPPALSSNYTITLPSLPASTKMLRIDNSGNISSNLDVDNSSLEISSNTLQVKANGVTGDMIASGVDLNGDAKVEGLNIVVANDNTDTPLSIIRGRIQITFNASANVSGTTTILTGGGFTIGASAGRLQTINFTNAFSDVPSITCQVENAGLDLDGFNQGILIRTPTTGAFTLDNGSSGTYVSKTINVNFIVIGQRV